MNRSTLDMPVRLPESKKDFQHPLSDSWFAHSKAIMEACAIDNGGCEECDLRSGCVKLFDSLADKCYDHHLSPHDFLEWIVHHAELILGEKITNTKQNKNNLPVGYVITGKLLIKKCLRCNHEWPTENPSPTICPKCKSPYWNIPKKVNN